MEITPKISLGGAIKAVVSNSPDKPEEIPKIVENKEYIINEYIQIRIIKENTIFPFDDTIDSVKIEFKVDKAWVKQYNIDIDTILIKEFSESVSGDDSTDWQVLPQKLLNEDENYLYYTVTVDSPNCLATFAIIGSKTVKVNSYSTQGGEISWTAIMGVIVVATFLLLVILFKAGYIYTEEYYIKKPKKIQNHRNINIIRQTVIVLLFWI